MKQRLQNIAYILKKVKQQILIENIFRLNTGLVPENPFRCFVWDLTHTFFLLVLGCCHCVCERKYKTTLCDPLGENLTQTSEIFKCHSRCQRHIFHRAVYLCSTSKL